MSIKLCRGCNKEKEESNFYKNRNFCKQCVNEHRKEYLSRPDIQKRNSARTKDYQNRPEIKDRRLKNQQRYRKKPEVKDKIRKNEKIYLSRPEIKVKKLAYNKEYRSRPEVIKKKAEYGKKYRSIPEKKAHIAKYRKEYGKIYRSKIENKDKYRRYQKEYVKTYLEKPDVKKRLEKYKREYYSRSEVKAKYKKRKEYHKAYLSIPEVVERRKRYSEKYFSNIENKKRVNAVRKERYHKDTYFRTTHILRVRTRKSLLQQDAFKKYRLKEVIGCSLDFLKDHLTDTARQNGYVGFDINNFSGKEYHVDHIVPCSAFYLRCSYHQKMCFNWGNLQILSSKDNHIKSAKCNIGLL